MHLCLVQKTCGLLFRGQIFSCKFVFGGSFGMSLEGECHEVEVTCYLELLVPNGISLEGVGHEQYT